MEYQSSLTSMLGKHPLQFCVVFVLLMMAPLSGCLGSNAAPSTAPDAEPLETHANPCTLPSEGQTQAMTTITVNGIERYFRLTTPTSDAATKLPLVLAFHGGGGAEEDFQQQNEFDQLAQQEQFIMVYAIAEEDRTAAEGEWFLNTAATSRDDNDFAQAMVAELSSAFCIDHSRLYAVGYSLGSMFTYEVACQLNHQFAAVASFAGTMPVAPESCDLNGNMAVLHIHGKLDYIIDYDNDWDWKDGEHEGVGTMSSVPGMISAWSERANCASDDVSSDIFVEHITHSGCLGDTRIEHYGLEFHEHTWPDQVDGTPTYQLIWDFLNDFTNE